MLRDWLGGRWKIIIKGLKDTILGVAQASFELYNKTLTKLIWQRLDLYRNISFRTALSCTYGHGLKYKQTLAHNIYPAFTIHVNNLCSYILKRWIARICHRKACAIVLASEQMRAEVALLERNEWVNIIILVLYYRIALVYTKTTIHLFVVS